MLASIPSPSSGRIGPLRAYSLCIVIGVVVAVTWASRRWQRRGGNPDDVTALAMWAVPGGIIGARLYHVITDNQLYRHHPLNAFRIWEGGLGIWGGIAGGVLGGLDRLPRAAPRGRALMDVAAPTFALAQAIGRLGNWFNQELFGRPTTLPWGLRIDLSHRPIGYDSTAPSIPRSSTS